MFNKLKISLAALLTSAALIVAVDKATHETLLLNSQVDATSMSELIREITNDGVLLNKLMRTTLIINSPGGYVSQLDLFKEVLKTQGRVLTTELPRFAASAASDIFLLGETRLMHRDATILFHEVAIMLGQFRVTYSDLKSILENDTLAPNSALASATRKVSGVADLLNASTEDFDIVKAIKNALGDELRPLVEQLEATHNEHIKFLMSRTGMSEAEVRNTLLITNIDTTLTFEQALAHNIATGELK